jgi:predicted transcriptional regulator
MSIIKGLQEMLGMLQSTSNKVAQSFSDLTKISINNKRLSTATVSKRLNELISVKAMEGVITKSKKGRRTISYKTTEKGKGMIEPAKKLEKALSNRD